MWRLTIACSLPVKVDLMMCLYSLQRDPAVWPRAEEFLPERHLPGHEALAPSDPQASMPFGHGSRMCPGYKLALLEGRLTLISILQRFAFSPPPDSCPKTKHRSALVYAAPHVWLSIKTR
jgi:thromboxane-A synthase/cytochrome P450 family 3 subfamily A